MEAADLGSPAMSPQSRYAQSASHPFSSSSSSSPWEQLEELGEVYYLNTDTGETTWTRPPGFVDPQEELEALRRQEELVRGFVGWLVAWLVGW